MESHLQKQIDSQFEIIKNLQEQLKLHREVLQEHQLVLDKILKEFGRMTA